MSINISISDNLNHREIQDLLPWFVAQTLDENEHLIVQAHLDICPQCRSELVWQRKLKAAEPQYENLPDMNLALSKLMPRLSMQDHKSTWNIVLDFFRNFIPLNQGKIRWALALQMVVIVGLSVLLAFSNQTLPAYRMLGAQKIEGANVVVVFRPDITEKDLRLVLRKNGARVVDGPTETDAYLLNVAEAGQAQAITQLRSDPAVVLAESLSVGVSH